MQEDYYEAAVIGEFLARHQPKAAGAKRCAHLALAALDALARQEKQAGRDASYEAAKSADLAEYVVSQWADQPEAAVAVEVLLNSAISAGDYDKAMVALKRIPADSAARTDAEVRLGQALWSMYLRRVQELREHKAAGETAKPLDDPKVKQELDVRIKQAQDALEHAVGRLRKAEELSDRDILALVSLAKLYVNQSQCDKAIAILEDKKLGPLTLLEAKNPSTQGEGVPTEIYKTAIRAYVGAEPQQLDKAAAALNSLERLSKEDNKLAGNFTQLLVGIAYDLVQQLDDQGHQGDKEKQARLATAIDKFLSRVQERAGTADYATLSWMATTYESLAAAVSPDESSQTRKLSADAENYYRQAIKAYDEILVRGKSDPNFVPPGDELAIKRHVAIDHRSVGNYDKSIAAFAEILKDKPNLLPVQVEAARAYQMRGENENPVWYGSAIKGGSGPAESIWGWGKVAVKTGNNPKFRDTFHEARYNIALCRKEWAESYKDADKRRQELELAKDAIRGTKDFESTLGGEKWKPQYEKLLKSVQKELDQPVVGLLEFEPKTNEPAANDSKK
jgi:hypothetical protein